MQTLLARKEEQIELEDIYSSKKPEFTVVYGRRRVGKTFLIKQFFKKKRCLFFYVTGIKDAPIVEQLTEFAKTIGKCFYNGATIATPTTWMNAFEELHKAIATQRKTTKIVLFMDEFPWMATKKSRLIQALEYYWNRFWCNFPTIKLIICGSSAAWIVKKILYHKGGLHNRITRKIILKSFTLAETKCFLTANTIHLNHQQLLQVYLAMGGIPFYLEQLNPKKSIARNINDLFFKENSILFDELNKLFQSLFENHQNYLLLLKIIANTQSGISRSKIALLSKKLFSGGHLTEGLNDLEMAGFIKSFLPLMHSRQGIYYRIIDEFSYFYLKWVEPEKNTLLTLDLNHRYWLEKAKTSSYITWAGYAFENTCYKHIPSIKKALDVSEDARIGTWRYIPKINTEERGAQIDLLFEQNDSILLCEIKCTNKPFVIDKNIAEQLIKKINIFKKVTKTKKQIFLVFISASGIKLPRYSELFISANITLNDIID